MSRGFPQGMTIAPKDNLYYAQYDMEYSVGGNGDNVIKADNYKLNLNYNPSKAAPQPEYTTSGCYDPKLRELAEMARSASVVAEDDEPKEN